MTRRRKLRPLHTACALAALLAGCSVLPKQETVHVWQPATTLAPAATPAGDFSLRVDTPHAASSLDQAGIVVMPAPGQVSTYQGARWSETPAVLLRQRLVDAFMAAQLPTVTTDDEHFASDFVLSGELRSFQTEYRAGVPVVVVRYDAQLRRGLARDLLATHSFSVVQNPSGAAVPHIVTAFGAADDQLAREVVAWVEKSARAAAKDAAPAH